MRSRICISLSKQGTGDRVMSLRVSTKMEAETCVSQVRGEGGSQASILSPRTRTLEQGPSIDL